MTDRARAVSVADSAFITAWADETHLRVVLSSDDHPTLELLYGPTADD